MSKSEWQPVVSEDDRHYDLVLKSYETFLAATKNQARQEAINEMESGKYGNLRELNAKYRRRQRSKA